MNLQKKKNQIETLKYELDSREILNPILKPETLSKFKQCFKNIFGNLCWMIKRNSLENSQQIEKRLRQILTLLKESHPELTLSYLMKKMAFIFLFINKSCFQRLMDESLISYLQDEIGIINKQISTIINDKQKKRSNSFTKVCGFIRSFSLSQTKKQEPKLKIEQLDDKVVFKQILKNCFDPFCHYLLKILQDSEAYISTIRKDKVEIQQFMNWKIINWAKKLCDIVVEINRLAKYFRDELIGVWVFMNYLISVDLSIYCDTLINKVQKQCEKWIQKIMIIQKFMTISKKKMIEQAQQVLKHPEFIQLRRQMEQLDKIRQKLNFLYKNSKIEEWTLEFVFPRPFNPQKKKQMNLEECVKQFIQLCQKTQNKNMIQIPSPQKQSNNQPKRTFSLVSPVKCTLNNSEQTVETPPTQKMAQKTTFEQVYPEKKSENVINSQSNDVWLKKMQYH